jgi:hypothetical protein
MKKALSIVLAVVFVMVFAVTAFADVNNNSIIIGSDKDSGISLNNGLLKPGEEYRFPISVAINGADAAALNDDILDEYTLKFQNSGEGNSLSDMAIEKFGGVYYLVATVKAGWPATQTEEEYTLKLSKKGTSKDETTLTVNFTTGYAQVDDSYVDSLDYEDEVTVNNDAPVFTTEQIERIARTNEYDKVTLEGNNWSYNVNISGMKNTNMLYKNDSIKEILDKYPNNSFEFLTFPAGPQFKALGTLKIDVSNYADSYNEQFYVYRYNGSKLTLIKATYDPEEEILSFNTSYLDRFVITDKKVNLVWVVTGNNSGTSTLGSVAVNPSTGAAV